MTTERRGWLLLAILSQCLAVLAASAQSDLLVITSDFQTGSISFVSAETGVAVEKNLLTIHSDAVARYRQGKVYIVNRLGQDNVLILDRSDLSQPLLQFSVGNGSNPLDIAFASDNKAYVSRFGSASVLVVDPVQGNTLGEIDLSVFADDDGIPEMAQMATVGSRLYVALQRLDRDNGFAPVAPGYIAVIDMETDALVDVNPEEEGIQAWTLAAPNPASLIALGSTLYVSETSAFRDAAGGIEILDTTDLSSRGLVVTETELGGDVTWLSPVSAARGFAVVVAGFNNDLVPINLEDGTVGTPLEGHSGGFTPSLTVDGSHLLVPDRGAFDAPESAGLLVFDVDSGELLAGPIDVGLPPGTIVVLKDAPITAVLESPGSEPNVASLDPAYPNPFNGGTTIPFVIGDHLNGEARLSVYDALGRRVRMLRRSVAAGSHTATWDGRDDMGRLVGSGPYVVELLLPGGRSELLTRKVTLVK
jgi:hypothetical protein